MHAVFVGVSVVSVCFTGHMMGMAAAPTRWPNQRSPLRGMSCRQWTMVAGSARAVSALPPPIHPRPSLQPAGPTPQAGAAIPTSSLASQPVPITTPTHTSNQAPPLPSTLTPPLSTHRATPLSGCTEFPSQGYQIPTTSMS